MNNNEFFPTLDGALTEVAGLDAYTAVTIERADGGYLLKPDYPGGPDDLPWDYRTGIDVPDGVTECTRAFEPCEFWDSAAHVRYNLSESVAAIEAGRAISFQWLPLYSESETAEDIADDADGLYDGHVGWAMITRDYGPAED